MLDFLSDLGTPTVVALTKVDKLSPSARAARIDALTASLGLDADQVIAFSAQTGAGRDALAAAIVALTEPEAGTPPHVP
jgi:GTP-binding protein